MFLALYPAPGSAEPSLRVGVIYSGTGIAAEDGKTVIQALRLARRDLEQRNGNLKVEFLLEDDQTSQRNAVTAFRKLKARNVDVIFGATWDFTTNTIIPLAGKEKVVLFNTSSLPESLNLSGGLGFAFANGISVVEEARPFERFISEHKPETFAVIYANNAWGETQKREYERIASRYSLKKVLSEPSVGYEENEWRGLLPRLKSANADLILMLLNKNDLTKLLRRMREQRVSGRLFASKNAFDALQDLTDRTLFENLCFTYPLERLQRNADFERRYFGEFGESPRIYADNTYDALFLVASAASTAREKGIPLSAALRTSSYKGLVGSYAFRESNSFSQGSSSLVCVREGALTVNG